MDLKNLMPGDAVAAVYAGVPSVAWEFASPNSGPVSDEHAKTQDVLNAKMKKYCPGCKQANTLREVEPTVSNGDCRYKCRSCDGFFKRPMALLAKGPSQSSSHVSRVNAGSRIARAMEASLVMGAVEELPEVLRLWTLWVYTDPEPEQRDNLEGRVLAALVDNLDEVEKENIKGVKVGADAIRVISMQMNSFRHDRRLGKPLYRAADYARAICRDRKQFSPTRLWGRFCAAAVAEMSKMDAAAMEPVQDVLVALAIDDGDEAIF